VRSSSKMGSLRCKKRKKEKNKREKKYFRYKMTKELILKSGKDRRKGTKRKDEKEKPTLSLLIK